MLINPKEKNETRETKVLKFIENFGSITPLEAWKYCGTSRLSAAIYNLKKMGYVFNTERVRVFVKDGSFAYVAKYSLVRK